MMTMDGQMPEHGYTLNSPGEPDGSGEVKKLFIFHDTNSLSVLLGPVVQSIISLTMSLRRQLVKYMWTKLSNTLLLLLKKCENLLHCKRFSHFFNKK